MSLRTAIIAAAPGELRPLVRGWQRVPASKHVHAWRRGDLLAICAGMGADAATRAFAFALSHGSVGKVISVGWAGALRADLKAGEVFEAAQVRDTKTGERFDSSENQQCEVLLLTTPRVAGREEKSRLAASYPGAAIVDMEAATVARLAAASGIPFRAIKAVSDTLEEELPDLNPFIDRSGQFHVARFAMGAALRPRYWPGLVRFGRQAGLAANNLCASLARELGTERI